MLMHVFAKSRQSCLTLCNPMGYSPPGFSANGDSPGKNTGMGCHALFQGIFQTQGLNPRLLCFLHWQVGSLPLVPPGKPGKWHSFILLYDLVIFYCIFIHSSDGHLRNGHFIASSSWLLCVYLFELWYSLDICPKVKLKDHMVALFSV